MIELELKRINEKQVVIGWNLYRMDRTITIILWCRLLEQSKATQYLRGQHESMCVLEQYSMESDEEEKCQLWENQGIYWEYQRRKKSAWKGVDSSQ